MAQPQLYGDYHREAVHQLFEPDTAFTPQAGKWGLPGIVRITERPGDFVLFVTFGKQEAAHAFDESISDIGILRWQSQPAQRFTSQTVINLIGHNERLNMALSKGCGRLSTAVISEADEPQIEGEARQSVSVFPLGT